MLVILQRKDGWYHTIKNEPLTTDLLADFLTDDVGGRPEEYIADFEDDKDHAGAMNATQFSKDDGLVIITPEYLDETECIAKGDFFKIKAKVLAKLLKQWKEVYNKQPLYIAIMIENDIPTVVGADELRDIL